jgi:hypothetical protein
MMKNAYKYLSLISMLSSSIMDWLGGNWLLLSLFAVVFALLHIAHCISDTE